MVFLEIELAAVAAPYSAASAASTEYSSRNACVSGSAALCCRACDVTHEGLYVNTVACNQVFSQVSCGFA
jgi:hypothetical protein